MTEKTKNILLTFDEVNQYETPLAFNYREIELNVEKLKSVLNNVFNLEFVIDNKIEDASFYCDIRIPNQLVLNYTKNTCKSIRISNFGQLSTINIESYYSLKTVQTIKKVLVQSGFIYISSDELNEDYDGKFTDFHHILGGSTPSWHIRYFDYL